MIAPAPSQPQRISQIRLRQRAVKDPNRIHRSADAEEVTDRTDPGRLRTWPLGSPHPESPLRRHLRPHAFMTMNAVQQDAADALAPRHFLAWIPHERPVNAPKLDMYTSSIATRAFQPKAHVTGQLGLAHRIRPADVIWLVGNFPKLGRPEAALDGRIVVASVRTEDSLGESNVKNKKIRGKLIFTAGDGSRWLPGDASALLYNCKFLCRTATPGTFARDQSLGQQMHRTPALVGERRRGGCVRGSHGQDAVLTRELSMG